MIFSKSFGYAVRSVLYIASVKETSHCVQAGEVAAQLAVPRYFISKILKRLVKAGVLSSAKGKAGGFMINDDTTAKPLMALYALMDGDAVFHNCSLRLQACNVTNPCPLHQQMEGVKHRLHEMLKTTTLGELLSDNKDEFLKSITTQSE